MVRGKTEAAGRDGVGGRAGNGSCAEACAGNAVLPRKKTDPFWGIAAGDLAAQGPGKGRGSETERGRGWGRTA